MDSRTFYCRAPEKWFGADIQRNDSDLLPKIRVTARKIGDTGQKSEIRPGGAPKSEPERGGVWIFLQKRALKPLWIRLMHNILYGNVKCPYTLWRGHPHVCSIHGPVGLWIFNRHDREPPTSHPMVWECRNEQHTSRTAILAMPNAQKMGIASWKRHWPTPCTSCIPER